MAVLFRRLSEKSGCLLALAGFLVGEGLRARVRARGQGGGETASWTVVPTSHPAPVHRPYTSSAASSGEAQSPSRLPRWGGWPQGPKPNSSIPKTFFCFVGMTFFFFLSLLKEEETNVLFFGPSKGYVGWGQKRLNHSREQVLQEPGRGSYVCSARVCAHPAPGGASNPAPQGPAV